MDPVVKESLFENDLDWLSFPTNIFGFPPAFKIVLKIFEIFHMIGLLKPFSFKVNI